MTRTCLFVTLFALLLAGCASPSSADLQAATDTAQAQTAAAASPTLENTPTATSTSTPLPTDTPTSTLTPTETPVPPTPTETEIPTETATPGPITFHDNFARENSTWNTCLGCRWQDGALYRGPYKPSSDQKSYSYIAPCEDCSTPTFFRMSVDVSYVEGPADRGFGLAWGITDDSFTEFEITTFQFALIFQCDELTQTCEVLNRRYEEAFSGLLNPGEATNRIEVVFQPASMEGRGDLFVNINGKNDYVIYNLEPAVGQVGLLVGFHSIGVKFDNFNFEEIWPEAGS